MEKNSFRISNIHFGFLGVFFVKTNVSHNRYESVAMNLVPGVLVVESSYQIRERFTLETSGE